MNDTATWDCRECGHSLFAHDTTGRCVVEGCDCVVTVVVRKRVS